MTSPLFLKATISFFPVFLLYIFLQDFLYKLFSELSLIIQYSFHLSSLLRKCILWQKQVSSFWSRVLLPPWSSTASQGLPRPRMGTESSFRRTNLWVISLCQHCQVKLIKSILQYDTAPWFLLENTIYIFCTPAGPIPVYPHFQIQGHGGMTRSCSWDSS